MLTLNQPMSSPQMMRMLGLFFSWAWAVDASASAESSVRIGFRSFIGSYFEEGCSLQLPHGRVRKTPSANKTSSNQARHSAQSKFISILRKFTFVAKSGPITEPLMSEIPPTPVSRLQTTEPDVIRASVRGIKISALQVGPTSAASELTRIPLPGQQLDLVQLSAAFEFEGVTCRENATVIFVLAAPGHAHNFNFGTNPGPGHIGFWPTEGPLHSITPAGYRNASLTLPLADLVKELESREVRPPPHFYRTGAALTTGPSTVRSMQRLAGEIRSVIAADALTADDPRWRVNLQRVSRTAFSDALATGLQQVVPQPRLTLRKSEIRFRLARDYMAAHLGQPVYLEDLCTASGLSRRSLQQIFRDKTGISPMEYLCLRRLHGARHELKCGMASVSVKTIAFRWGFWHLGRFSAEYRRVFGELPSTTREHRKPL